MIGTWAACLIFMLLSYFNNLVFNLFLLKLNIFLLYCLLITQFLLLWFGFEPCYVFIWLHKIRNCSKVFGNAFWIVYLHFSYKLLSQIHFKKQVIRYPIFTNCLFYFLPELLWKITAVYIFLVFLRFGASNYFVSGYLLIFVTFFIE